ncbi:hypothetical protein D0T49_02940 [Paludibacter sp. 221]|uniref:carboxypeptidase regulatory-like domain-containing protein n=1 Tax=Paludibacter sp. 221 TaxID=2302939 RepID=UPI0013D85D64|nr:carboxypeptidase regulatory-like domain-containing protein [Paludibacter sp. 221]NDV45995.1 hypothetical protein [Paludibacter sp. 221]
MRGILKLLILSVLISVGFSACTKNEVNMYGDIRGFVTNTVTGEPIRNANVKLLPGGNTTNTGSDGSYEFKNLSAGQYTVQVMSTNYQSNTKGVTVYAGEINQCDIPLTPGSGMLEIQNPNAYFGTNNKSLSVTLKNIGKETLEWYVDYDADWIVSVSPAQGKIQENGVAIITIRIDRTKIPDNTEKSTIINVTSNGGNIPIYVSVNGSTNPGNASNVVRNGLYAYYTFEDNTKNLIEGNINAVAISNPDYITGAPDGSKAMFFNGKSYINIAESLIDTQRFSVSFWAKGFKDGHIFSVSCSDNTAIFTMTMRDNMLSFIIDNTYSSETFTHADIIDNEWHMITITSENKMDTGSVRDPAVNKLYVDGEYTDVLSERPYYTTYGAGVKFIFGGDAKIKKNTVLSSNLSVDNLRIYNTRVLSDIEIKQIYNAEKGN